MKKTIFHFVKSNYLTGVENVVINICTLVKGYNYTVVSTKGPLDKYLEHYGINHITIPNLNPITILNVIKKYNPDIVQAHDAKMTVLLSFSGLYCHRHHIGMISELHNNDPKMHKWWELRTLLYLLASFEYENIISVSNQTVRDYSFHSFINKKSTVISNVVNPYRIKENLNSTRVKKWDCIFVGRFVYQKNPFRFIKLIYDLKKYKKNVKAIMIGTGPLLNSSKKLASYYKVKNNIKFKGFQYNPYIYMQESRFLIMTSRYEGLPLVALESIITGTPVISTPLSGLINIFGDLANMRNNNEFVKTILNLMNDKNKYKYCCKYANHQMCHINDISKFVNAYRSIYEL